ncbi:hypothetical protein TNCV_5003451 [Trichonephila clavipes]|nr:hypothetical protein TNCV_5003451 [Trichonephila clavipes]
MNRKIDELKDRTMMSKDISESELQVIEADIQSMEDRLEKLETVRGLLSTDHVILNHGQVTWTTPELAPLLTTTPHLRDYRTEEDYVVQLPLKKDPYCLGSSRFLAEVRLNQFWKKTLETL